MELPQQEFHTLKGYQLLDGQTVTASMQDYLEMICRELDEDGSMRINTLAAKLHVRPSSASKMVNKLRSLGFVSFERYGLITPTPKGTEVGEYLLYRHDLLHRFFCFLNHSDCELELVERIEHFIDERTVHNIAVFMENKEKQA